MKNKLTKAELIKNINDSTGIDAVSIGIVINQMFEELKEALIDNRTIELRGFGTFAPKIRKAKAKAHNPKTGEPCSVEAHRVATFKQGQELKKALWSMRVSSSLQDSNR